MVHVAVVVGQWVRRDECSVFEVDHSRGGRLFYLPEGCKHSELLEMVFDDYLLDKKSLFVELSYSLPNDMLNMMPPDSPPTFVSSDRQVRAMMELCRTKLIRLCVTIRCLETNAPKTSVRHHDNEFHAGGSGGIRMEDDMVDGFSGVKADVSGDETDDDWEADSEDMEAEVGGDVKADEFKEEDDSDVDYSVYGKVEDENKDESNLPFDLSMVKPVDRWSDNIEVGKSFDTKAELVSELHMMAVQQKFAFKSPKSNKTCLVATCVVEGCQWKLRASEKNEPGVFWVTKYVKLHTCSIADRRSNRRRCTPRYIAQLFIERVGIIDGIVPKHVQASMRKAYGLKMDYSTSYRAWIFARQLVRGTPESGYESLPSYLKQIEETNPGTVTDLVIDDQNRFKYVFLSLGASIHGFQ